MPKCSSVASIVRWSKAVAHWREEPISVIVPLLMLAIMVLSPQVFDMFDARDDRLGRVWGALWFGVSAFILGFSSWFWMRAALSADRGIDDYSLLSPMAAGEDSPLTWEEEHAPRATIVLTFLIVVSPWMAWAHQYLFGETEPREPPVLPVIVAIAFIGLLWAFVRYRRRLFQGGGQPAPPNMWRYRSLSLLAAAPFGWPTAVFVLALSPAAILLVQLAPGFVEQQLSGRTAVFGSLALVIGPFVMLLALFRDGIFGLLRLACSSWASLFNRNGAKPQVDLVSARVLSGFLGFWILLLLFVGVPNTGEGDRWYVVRKFSPVSAGARASAVPRGSAVAGRPSLKEALQEWRDSRGPPGKKIPLVVVAAEGGASRGAVWLLSAMGLLDETTDGRFSQSLFAISSVSGGSLGAVSYLLAQRSYAGAEESWDMHKSEKTKAAVKALANADLLAAPVATYFLSDPFGRVFRAAWPGYDRGVALEYAFERHWRGHWNADVANTGFLELRKDIKLKNSDGAPLSPSHLLLNGADVSSGRRVITSTIKFDDDDALLVNAVDLLAELGSDVYASTAVTNSARFPYVSPAGRWETAGRKHQLVDGGYYENYGAETAFELLERIQYLADRYRIAVVPVAVVISNDVDGCQEKDVDGCQKQERLRLQSAVATKPEGDAALERALAKQTVHTLEDVTITCVRPERLAVSAAPKLRVRPEQGDSRLISDFLAPLAGVVATRGAHGQQALLALRSCYCPTQEKKLWRMIHIALPRPAKGEAAPMNWVLNGEAATFLIEKAVKEPFNLDQAAQLRTTFDYIRDGLAP